jgi:hypothetical protein
MSERNFLEVEYFVDNPLRSDEIRAEIFGFIQSLNLEIGEELNS